MENLMNIDMCTWCRFHSFTPFYLVEQRRIVDSVLNGEANKYHIDASDIQPRVIESKLFFLILGVAGGG